MAPLLMECWRCDCDRMRLGVAAHANEGGGAGMAETDGRGGGCIGKGGSEGGELNVSGVWKQLH